MSQTPFVDFPAGSTMLREGEAAGALFIVEAGKAAIERNGAVLAELGPGDVFGEAALLQEQGHAANVVARTAVRALRLDAATLPAVLRENVDVAIQLMRRLSLRLRAAEMRATEPLPPKPAGVAADAQARSKRADLGAAAATAAPEPDVQRAPAIASPAPDAQRAAAIASTAPDAPRAPAIASPAPDARRAPGMASPASEAVRNSVAASPDSASPRAAPAATPAPDSPRASATASPAQPVPTTPVSASPPIDTRARSEALSPAPAGAPAPTAQAVPAAPAVITHVLRHAQGVIAVPADKAECLVGRPDPATGAIPEINLGPLDLARSLSRRHARLLVTGNTVSLREEPGVANGTWVNGERLAAGQSVNLEPGDKLRFGAIELEFAKA